MRAASPLELWNYQLIEAGNKMATQSKKRLVESEHSNIAHLGSGDHFHRSRRRAGLIDE